MTDRIRLDDLTSDQLDALYDRIATLESVAAGNKRHVQLIVPELERAEAAIARVRAIHTHGPRTNTCNDCGQPWPCEVTRALDGHPEKALADALGGHRAAQVIAHTLYCHGYTLDVVQRMTDAELRAVPGIGDTSLATIRNALGQPGPAAGGCSAPIPRTEPNNTGRAAAEATEPVRCPCDGTHFPSPENCQWCKCHRAWTPPPPGDRREATLRAAVHHDGNHLYLSTGCLHHDHAYCNNMTGLNGAKRPGECKHCGARCICACHTAPGP